MKGVFSKNQLRCLIIQWLCGIFVTEKENLQHAQLFHFGERY